MSPKGNCVPVAQSLLDNDAADQLEGALVTGDALNTQKKRRSSSATAATTCDNQPTLHQLAQHQFSAAIPDEWVSDWEKHHGRIERRRLARVDLDQDISPFPGAQQLIRIVREWMDGKSTELKSETRYFITSLAPAANQLTRQPPCSAADILTKPLAVRRNFVSSARMKRTWWLVIPWFLVCSCKKPEVATASGSPESARKSNDEVQVPAPAGADTEEAAANERTRPSQRPEPKVYAKPKPDEYPPAVVVQGKPGFVISPYNGKIIDVNGLPPGTLVADPTFPAEEKKFFRTPP